MPTTKNMLKEIQEELEASRARQSIIFNTAYSKPVSKPAELHQQGGITEQNHTPECDINRIVKQYETSGILPEVEQEPTYGDATGDDFQNAQNLVANAKSQFETLPPKIRTEFNNDVRQFLDFVSDPKTNLKRGQELGIFALYKPKKDLPEDEANGLESSDTPKPPKPAPSADIEDIETVAT